MYYCQHINTVRKYLINDSVRAFNYFSDILALVLWDRSPRKWKRTYLFGAFGQSIGHLKSIKFRILRNPVKYC